MSKLFEKVKGDPKMDTTMSFKINTQRKAKIVDFFVKHGISTGDALREGLDMVYEQLKKELEAGE